MKKVLTLLLISCFFLGYVQAQVPGGMQYQAVARDLKGNIIAHQPISLKITLLAEGATTFYYVENHSVTTNELGLFTLVIGGGNVESGNFANIPWSSQNIWLQVAIKDKNQTGYTTISNSKLLSVPYAFYSGTAGALTGTNQAQISAAVDANDACGCNEGIKSLQLLYLGNNNVTIKVFENKDLKKQIAAFSGKNNGDIITVSPASPDKKLPNSIYFQVNNSASVTEMPTNCNDAIIGETFGNFSVIARTDVKNNVTCSVCEIKKDWKVGGNVTLAACNALGNKNKNDLVIITDNTERMRVTTGGDVNVVNNLSVGQTLTVTGATTLQNTLDVTGATHLKNTLTTDGINTITNSTQSTATGNGALVIAGGVGIGGNLNVAGSTNFGSVGTNNLSAKSLSVVNDTTGYLAIFQNTNTGEGDGIKIKLGKEKTFFAPPALPALNENILNNVKDLINNNFIANKLANFGNIVVEGAKETGKVLAGLAVGAGNMIINVINDKLDLPLKIGPYSTPNIHIWDETEIFGGIGMPPGIPDVPSISIPALNIPSKQVLPQVTVMPKLPQIDLTSIGVPTIDFTDMNFWSVPSFDLSDITTNPLNNSNEFIRFSDKNDVRMGSIKAASLKDFSDNYLNPVFLYRLYGAITSSTVDKVHALYHFKSEIFKVMKDYYYLGVEYTSGNGDYAEWLPRIDKAELISQGDIVGVFGGKITKNLAGAEQVMVVSHNPIILGNVPPEGKGKDGNDIAFMGQVPVKIVGPVISGDYIIGQSNTPGYGIAKHPNKMTIEDFRNAVGRSWVTDESDLPKMVNTVVGVHNNNFLNIIKELKQNIESNGERIKAIENRLNTPVSIKSKMAKKQPLK